MASSNSASSLSPRAAPNTAHAACCSSKAKYRRPCQACRPKPADLAWSPRRIEFPQVPPSHWNPCLGVNTQLPWNLKQGADTPPIAASHLSGREGPEFTRSSRHSPEVCTCTHIGRQRELVLFLPLVPTPLPVIWTLSCQCVEDSTHVGT